MNPKPYSVAWGWCNESGADFATLDQAIVYALTVAHCLRRRGDLWPSIVNSDQYDADWNGERYVAFDGLDDDEVERLEMAGLR